MPGFQKHYELKQLPLRLQMACSCGSRTQKANRGNCGEGRREVETYKAVIALWQHNNLLQTDHDSPPKVFQDSLQHGFVTLGSKHHEAEHIHVRDIGKGTQVHMHISRKPPQFTVRIIMSAFKQQEADYTVKMKS